MNDLELQERLSEMSIPEIIESITSITEIYTEYLAALTHEILIRAMQQAE